MEGSLGEGLTPKFTCKAAQTEPNPTMTVGPLVRCNATSGGALGVVGQVAGKLGAPNRAT